MKKLIIAGKEFNSRVFLGTGKFNSNTVMEEAILASGCEMVTVAMKRIELDDKEDDMLKHIIHPHIQLLQICLFDGFNSKIILICKRFPFFYFIILCLSTETVDVISILS